MLDDDDDGWLDWPSLVEVAFVDDIGFASVVELVNNLDSGLDKLIEVLSADDILTSSEATREIIPNAINKHLG